MAQPKSVAEWRSLCERYRSEAEEFRKKAQEVEQEFEEFVSSSKEIEAELDKELMMVARSKDQREKELYVVTAERDKLKKELVDLRAEKLSTDSRMNDELKALRLERDHLLKEKQRLEQRNDDLERELRISAETLRCTEQQLSEELEQHALLTTEVDENDQLKEQCQRLKDEVRDLKMDKKVHDLKRQNLKTVEHFSSVDIEQSSDKENQIQKGMENGLVNHDLYSTDFAGGDRNKHLRKNDVNGMYAMNSGVRPEVTCFSVARNVYPALLNLVKTVQGLEQKLLILRDRRTSVAAEVNADGARRS
ncbi:hypothetical protein AB6A40_000014 [Gnathostoma spinigerum]|uniref:NUDE domain-containing protein n=1 Tax=Gnathostoma spinigerum TaxID=75299 RepID=A0ABD6EAI2_9BILA